MKGGAVLAAAAVVLAAGTGGAAAAAGAQAGDAAGARSAAAGGAGSARGAAAAGARAQAGGGAGSARGAKAGAPVRIGLIDSGVGASDPSGHGSAVAAVLRESAAARRVPLRLVPFPDVNRAGFGQPLLMAGAIRRTGAGHMRVVNVSQTIPGRAGRVRRAPRWMQKSGLEWVYRITQEPGRLFARYASTVPRFVGLVLLQMVRPG